MSHLDIVGRWLPRVMLSAAVAVAFTLFALTATGYGDAFSLVARAADIQGPLRRLADIGVVHYVERSAMVPLPDKTMRVRIYAPAGESRQTVVLVSGLHPAGISEPRLVAFARELAKSRIAVVTPDIPGLTDFAITPALTDGIERVARWVAADSGLAPGGRIGLIGVSFSGGLTVVAAGRPSLRDHVLYVFSIGGHDDLPRVLQYLCTGVVSPHDVPADRPIAVEDTPPPLDYGQAVLLLNVADRLVPSDQVDALRALVRRFLWASYLDRDHKAQAAREFAAVREDAHRLPEPSQTLLGYLNNRDVGRLGVRLLPYVAAYGNAPGLSPSRSPRPTAPVFLLHGRNDNIVPATESQHLADRLRGHTPVTLLLTDLVVHADTDQPKRIVQVFKLIELWRALLAQ